MVKGFIVGQLWKELMKAEEKGLREDKIV